MPTTAVSQYNNAGLTPVYDHNQRAECDHIKLGNSLTLAKGTVMGQITATGLWKAYASGSVDGSEVPKAILAYDCVSDGSGNITIGGGSMGETYLTAPAFIVGDFLISELTGLDATALTNNPRWGLRWGTITTGCLHVA